MPLGRCVDALPSTGGTRTPPRMQSTQRAPDRVAPDATTSPAASAVAVQSGTTRRSRTRRPRPRRARRSGTCRRAASSRSRPLRPDCRRGGCRCEATSDRRRRTRRRRARRSRQRPRSCTVDSIPGSMTASATSGFAHALGSSDAGIGTNRTRSPARSSAGGSRSARKIASGVRPTIRHPPGVANG